ncbi:putative nucleic acid-binding protein [Rhizobium tibeticum]|uniref:PIN domain-containing protein n=1 Tax=Rhizobium tibeticum TaxID=501024 RepID=A0A1H8GJA0_9HYPH|nr:type II toxin-antitoxin system VapC family toxin [Rhizobium tibeticum]MDP9808610.1 putative nucleic acid-binding protein [Rhizobium tibeticum]SEH61829.1 hypothetical protein RTCCBAU85039_1435 [Rhizobium tibeticum]SEN43388.1 hypothetical protein SAMN05216228_1004245 [Rhizobium tibeticum]
MPFVVDASIAAAGLLPDEENVEAEAALSLLEIDDAVVPDLAWHDMRNILLVAERKRRIGSEDILACLVRLESLPCEQCSTMITKQSLGSRESINCQAMMQPILLLL